MSNLTDLLISAGGLTVTPITGTAIAALSALSIGKHYVVNMSGESADKICTLPAGSTGANIRIQVSPAHETYKLTVDGNGSEKVFYSGTDYDDIYFAAGLETWAEFVWNGTKWVVEDSTVPIKGTLSGSLSITGGLTVSGFTALGSGNVGIKCKQLTGTTGASEGLTTNIAHGLTGDKIVGVNCLVRDATNNAVSPNYTRDAEYEYQWAYDSTNIVVKLAATNSGQILSKPISVLIWYIE